MNIPENPYIQIIQQLSQAFHFFNGKLCEGKLPTPLIHAFPQGGKRTTLGWFWGERWAKTGSEKGGEFHEITICAELLHRPIAEVLETLLHEMAHLWNHYYKIPDVNKQGRHNKKFKKTAEEVFYLKVVQAGNKGWAFTSLTPESASLVEKACSELGIKDFGLSRVLKKGKTTNTFMIQVSQEDKILFDEIKEREGLSSKDLFHQIFEHYQGVENTLALQEV